MIGGCVLCVAWGWCVLELGGLLLSHVSYEDGMVYVWPLEESVVSLCNLALC